MIVKNEASVITRCLQSVFPLISSWVVVDTGSTDGTQDVVRRLMADVPGELYEREWQDFASNRSEALTLSRSKAQFSLVIDADDVLEVPEAFRFPDLTEDCYTVDIRDDELVYPRIQLVNNRLAWSYRGVLHEYISAIGSRGSSHLPIGIRRNHDGNRRKNPDLFLMDVEILRRALETETDEGLLRRYMFYLAQSYRDAGDLPKAIEHYLLRSRQAGWLEEVYYSLYQAGRLMEKLKHDDDEVFAIYRAASVTLPGRVEAMHAAARLCRVRGRYEEGYEIAKAGLGREMPAGALFGAPWIYEFGLLDEFAVNAQGVGKHRECLAACLKVIKTRKMGSKDLQRVFGNVYAALRNLSPSFQPKQFGETAGEVFINERSTSKKPFNVCIVRPNGYLWSSAFTELAELICYSLQDLGFPCRIRENSTNINWRNIVIGCHLIGLSKAHEVPSDSIIINTEQIGADKPEWTPRIVHFLKNFQAWDYSLGNISRLESLDIRAPMYFKLGYHPRLQRIRNQQVRDIDALFYGTMNEARENLLDSMQQHGLKVFAVYGLFGAQRDALIARSKLILNLHQHPTKIFETVRVNYLMSNEKAVLSQCDQQTIMEPDYRSGLELSSYENMVEVAQRLIGSPELLRQREIAALQTIKKLDALQIMREMLISADI